MNEICCSFVDKGNDVFHECCCWHSDDAAPGMINSSIVIPFSSTVTKISVSFGTKSKDSSIPGKKIISFFGIGSNGVCISPGYQKMQLSCEGSFQDTYP
jgi:hypothetical protein